jgi:transcriptional regulator with XRE-family HTH domain
MTLGEKIRHLRAVEGTLRGLGRPISQPEMVAAMKKEQKRAISQSYLSQIESGVRPHLSQGTRTLLSQFFKVHPGFLVDDAEGFETALTSELRVRDAKLDSWLLSGAQIFGRDDRLSHALRAVAEREDSRDCLLLLDAILKLPGLADRLREVL